MAGFGLWAVGTPGGVPARLDDAWDWVQGGVQRATADPQLKRAEQALNAWYSRAGTYPDRAAFDPAAAGDGGADSLPVGVSIAFCSPRHVVLSAFTSRGTVSRLLIDGASRGDVDGTPGCPVDPNSPVPW